MIRARAQVDIHGFQSVLFASLRALLQQDLQCSGGSGFWVQDRLLLAVAGQSIFSPERVASFAIARGRLKPKAARVCRRISRHPMSYSIVSAIPHFDKHVTAELLDACAGRSRIGRRSMHPGYNIWPHLLEP